MATSIEIEEIRLSLKEWCYAKRRDNEVANPQWPLFNCMDQAIISVIADMEARIRQLENVIKESQSTHP